jgi:hypothetical protein
VLWFARPVGDNILSPTQVSAKLKLEIKYISVGALYLWKITSTMFFNKALIEWYAIAAISGAGTINTILKHRPTSNYIAEMTSAIMAMTVPTIS